MQEIKKMIEPFRVDRSKYDDDDMPEYPYLEVVRHVSMRCKLVIFSSYAVSIAISNHPSGNFLTC